MLVGGFIYRQLSLQWTPEIGPTTALYVLSDFSIDGRRRLAKLVAMLASGQEQVLQFDRRRVQRTGWVTTTAFTDKPVSMKYRGIYKRLSKKPGKLNYASEVRRVSNADIYADWWKRYGKRAP